jgi:hypothetical protein
MPRRQRVGPIEVVAGQSSFCDFCTIALANAWPIASRRKVRAGLRPEKETWGGSLLHEWVGQPVEFLFVPSVFFWLDWRRTQPRSWLGAMARSVAEIVALVAWPYCWAVIQLMKGWLWI